MKRISVYFCITLLFLCIFAFLFYIKTNPIGKAIGDYDYQSEFFQSQEEEIAAYYNLLADVGNQRDGARQYLRNFFKIFSFNGIKYSPPGSEGSPSSDYNSSTQKNLAPFSLDVLSEEKKNKKQETFMACQAQYIAIKALAQAGGKGSDEFKELMKSYAKTCLKEYYKDKDSLVRQDTGLFFGGFGIAPVLPNYFRGTYNEAYKMLADAWPDIFGGVKYNGVPQVRFGVPHSQQGFSWEGGYGGGPMAIGMIRGYPIVYYIQEPDSNPHIQFIPDIHNLASTLNKYHFIITYPGGTAWNAFLVPFRMKWSISNLPTLQLTGQIKWCPGAGTIAIMTAGGGPVGLLTGIGWAIKCAVTGSETIVTPSTVSEFINDKFFEHILYGEVDSMALAATRWGNQGERNRMIGTLHRNVFLDSLYKLIVQRRIHGQTHKGEAFIHCSDEWETMKNLIKWMIFQAIEMKLGGVKAYFASEAVAMSVALGSIDDVLDGCLKAPYLTFCNCFEKYQKNGEFSDPESLKTCCDEEYIDFDHVQECLESMSPHWMWTVFKFVNPLRMFRITWIDLFTIGKALALKKVLPDKQDEFEEVLSENNCSYAMAKDSCYCMAETAAHYGWFLEEIQDGALGIDDLKKFMSMLSGESDTPPPICMQSFASKCICEELDKLFSCQKCWPLNIPDLDMDDALNGERDPVIILPDCEPDPESHPGCLTVEQYKALKYMISCEGFEECADYICDPGQVTGREDCTSYDICNNAPCDLITEWFDSGLISFDAYTKLLNLLSCSTCYLADTLKGMITDGKGGYTPERAYTGYYGSEFYNNWNLDCDPTFPFDDRWKPNPEWNKDTRNIVLSMCPDIRFAHPCYSSLVYKHETREDAINVFNEVITNCSKSTKEKNKCACNKLLKTYAEKADEDPIDKYIQELNDLGCPDMACPLIKTKYSDLLPSASSKEELLLIVKEYKATLKLYGCEDQLNKIKSIEKMIATSILGFTDLVRDISVILRELPYISY